MPSDGGPPRAGSLLAHGRGATVHDLGDGWLLRRHRDGRVDAAAEAAAMRLAAGNGIAVPAVRRAAGPELEIEHVPGPSLLAALLDDPGSAVASGRLLARLHRDLDGVPAPAALGLPRPAGAPGRLLHGDLHPGNVLLGPEGPVLIDWTDAGSGPGAHDTATTWLVLACLDPADERATRQLDRLRRPLVEGFLTGINRAAAAAALPRVAAQRLADPATTDDERARISAFAAAEAGS